MFRLQLQEEEEPDDDEEDEDDEHATTKIPKQITAKRRIMMPGIAS
jgi:hypothetical protein